jgi:hypothetical protein
LLQQKKELITNMEDKKAPAPDWLSHEHRKTSQHFPVRAPEFRSPTIPQRWRQTITEILY